MSDKNPKESLWTLQQYAAWRKVTDRTVYTWIHEKRCCDDDLAPRKGREHRFYPQTATGTTTRST